MELAIDTVRGSIEVPATGAFIDSVGSLLTRITVADDYWPILNKREQELLSLTHGLPDGLHERWPDATLRPKDMALEELVSADIFVRTMLALSGFMADLRFDFPWYRDLKLLALAILTGVFSVSPVAIRFFV